PKKQLASANCATSDSRRMQTTQAHHTAHPKTKTRPRPGFCKSTEQSGLFNFFEHFKYAFGRFDEQTLERFAQATTLDGVAPVTLDFCHDEFSEKRVLN